MRPLVKTSLVAAFFLVPMAWICGRPISKNPELVPLPYKVQAESAVLPVPATLEGFGSSEPHGVEILLPGDKPAAGAPVAEEPENQLMKKFSFNYGALEVEDRDAVRLKGAIVGVDYHVDDKQSLSVEGSQQIYDRQDAKAWGKGSKDESTAGIKYKLIF